MDRLRKQLRQEEDRLLVEKYKNRAEIKRMGERYTPWATYMWMQGKKIDRMEIGIKVLQNQETGEMRIEEAVKQEMEEYMKGVWGKTSTLSGLTEQVKQESQMEESPQRQIQVRRCSPFRPHHNPLQLFLRCGMI